MAPLRIPLNDLDGHSCYHTSWPWPCLMHGSLGPHESAPQMAYKLVQLFLQGSQQTWTTHNRTDWPRYSVCSHSLHFMLCIRYNLKMWTEDVLCMCWFNGICLNERLFIILSYEWQGIKRSRSPSPPAAAHYPSSHYPGQFASTSSYSGGSHGPIKQEPYVATSEYGKIPKTGKCCRWFGFLSLFNICWSLFCC